MQPLDVRPRIAERDADQPWLHLDRQLEEWRAAVEGPGRQADPERTQSEGQAAAASSKRRMASTGSQRIREADPSPTRA